MKCFTCGREMTTGDDFLQGQCYSCLCEKEKNKEIKKTYGWVCPVCGSVMAPHVSYCINCYKSEYKIDYDKKEDLLNE
jgi:NMD protein affecting ribosome stability and mRNA decay